MNTQHRSPLIPSAFELWCVGLASLALLILGNIKLFLQRYDLVASSSLVHDQLTSKVGTGLHALDSFGFTASVVTFAVWGVVGVLLISVVQAFLRTSRTLRNHREIGSSAYLHPKGFNAQDYWHGALVGMAASFAFTVLFATYAVFYLLFVLPVSFSHVRQFLLQASLGHLAAFVLGIVGTFVGTVLLYMAFRLAFWQRRFSYQ